MSLIRATLIILCLTSPFVTKAWGFFAHRLINRQAVYVLPPPLFSFYKKNIDYLTEHAVDADKRRYIDGDEACRHYLDVDRYEDVAPIDTIPHYWTKAIEKYTEDTLKAHGIVSWHIGFMITRLTKAFEEKNLAKILRLSADIGHYIADCHVPLHATKNYNGQLTGQEGIHGLWESRLPELFSDSYDKFTGKAVFLEKPNSRIWQALNESFAAKDSVLYFEKWVSERFNDDRKYSFEQRGNTTVKVYSKDFSTYYHNILNDQVERRLRSSIKTIADIWYTCWINAGQPNLDGSEIAIPEPLEDKELSEQESGFLKGKIIGRQEPH